MVCTPCACATWKQDTLAVPSHTQCGAPLQSSPSGATLASARALQVAASIGVPTPSLFQTPALFEAKDMGQVRVLAPASTCARARGFVCDGAMRASARLLHMYEAFDLITMLDPGVKSGK